MRRGLVLAMAAAALAAAAYVLLLRPSEASPLDLAAPPQTVFSTIPLEIGSTYTLGSLRIPEDVPRPVIVKAVSVVTRVGVEVVGVAAGGLPDRGIGLIPRWPPEEGYADPFLAGTTFRGPIEIVVGIRTTAGQSGLRGVDVRWVDGTGAEGRRVFDVAAVTCAPTSCTLPEDEIDGYLKQLGLEK